MIDKAFSRYYAIEEKLKADEELKLLQQRLQEASGQVHALMSQLTGEQRQILTEYIGICAEIDQRIVEIACFCEESIFSESTASSTG